jgi:hypothetical protein
MEDRIGTNKRPCALCDYCISRVSARNVLGHPALPDGLMTRFSWERQF